MAVICQKCHGTTFITQEIDGEMIAIPCDCRKEKEEKIAIEVKKIDAHIPRPFWDFTYENYLKIAKENLSPTVQEKNKKSLETYEKLLNTPNLLFEKGIRVIWIWGTDDSACHTTLSIILGTELIKSGVPVRFIRMEELINKLTSFDNLQKAMDELDVYKVFILDNAFDTGRFFIKSPYTKVALYNWIDRAMNNDKFFICTSNIKISEIHNDYLQSRIVLERSSLELEIEGSFINMLQRSFTSL